MAKILVVDDRASNRDYLTTLLDYVGHTMIEATDGAGALEKVRTEKPDLVITDILMPAMDGFEFVQHLRNDPALASTKVIFHTATYSAPQARALADSCGVHSVLSKPSDPDVVLDAVSRALGVQAPPIPRPNPTTPSPGATTRRIDDTLDLYFDDLRKAFGEATAHGAKAAVRRGQAKALSERTTENVARLQRIMSRLSALIEVGMEMDRERNPARLVEIFFAAACDIVDAKISAVALLDEKDETAKLVFAKGVDTRLLATGDMRCGLLGSILEQRRALRADRVDADLAAGSLPAGHPPVHSFLGIAIATESRAYGWLYFADRSDGRDFDAEDERLAAIMAAKLALLYENLQLYDLVQHHAADLQIEMASRERAERAASEAEANYRAVFENSVVGIFVVDPGGRVSSVSPALVRILGYDSAEDMLAGVSSVAQQVYVEKADRGRFYDMLRYQRVVEGFETRWRRKDGSVIWVSLSARLVGQGAIGHIGTAEDITERRRGEEELRRFRLALDNSADIVVITDRATMRFVDVNHTASRLLGYKREELLRMGPVDILPVPREEFERTYDELIANPSRAGGMQSYYLCKDGSHLPFESTRHVLRSGDSWLIVAISRDVRERLAAEKALRESEAQYRTTFELAGSGVAHVDMAGRFLRVNPKLCEIVGYSEQELVGRSVKELSHPEDRDVADAQRAKMHAGEVASMSFEKRHLRKDGTVVWVGLSVALQRDAEGKPLYEISIVDDITPRKLAEQRIERLNRVYAVLSGINGAIVRIRDRQELFEEACRIAVEGGGFRVAWIGIADQERQRVTPVAWNEAGAEFISALKDRLSIADGATNPSAVAMREKMPFVSNDIEQDARIVLKTAHSKLGIRAVAILPLIVAGEAEGVLALHSGEAGFFDDEEMKLLLELAGDIAFALDHIQKEEKLEYLAYYDSLTGLANRSLFLERLAQRTSAASRDRQKFALCMLNVERFKNINDSLGRQAGDDLLTQIAQRLLKAVGDPKFVARIGADQFAILVPDAREEQQVAHSVEDKLDRLDDEAFALGGSTVRISTKAGIALYPDDAIEPETLLRNAEAALRKAKTGGAPYLFYAPEMTARVLERLTLENKLRQAFEKDEFVLHYQPKVDLAKRSIQGVEALIRWQSPELGLVPPLKFIPLLEETGLIMPVGAWALKRAAADHRKLVEQGFKTLRVAVNVSPMQLRQRDFVASIEQAIIDGIAPTGIDLEITESLIMEDIKGNIEKLSTARGLGMKIAIDDFGTGYSSLGYLAKLPVQCLKIDRSFIITMDSDPNASTLVQTIISLAHSLGLEVVAEGVETEEQAKLLRLLRCDQMQGYLFSRPVPFDDLISLLKKTR